ncbi:MFS transporter [Novosphingobium sp. P6W]|uniref:MFS transporter n=1 Tax=Novosphingobium sp. P6W TaxID=1609758 RepID=UPI0005C300BA|nr:MFS transporter [Novosphingobium sp. P6W]AXB77325.1 MFS transporter [Novosphingobium sp. P6W]KIS33708.1 MFS transporter [Novosphingobium sp. P6W]
MANHSQTKHVHPALVTLALAMGAFAIGTTEFAAMSLVPFFARDLGLSEPEAGHAISAYALGVVVGAPVIAVLAAKIERRKLLIALMAIFAIGNGISAMAASYPLLLVCRFVSGLPHGAYFGIAALVAASMVPANKRAQSVAMVMSGLTVATIIGVPVANFLGQELGWRSGFAVVSVLAVITMALVALYAPVQHADASASPLRELGALRRPQVLLTLLTGAIGFGGLFCVYTYVASTMIEVTGVSERLVPAVLAIFGVGMTAGNLFWAWVADRAQTKAAIAALLFSAVSLALFSLLAGNIWTLSLVVLLIGFSGGLGTILQTRLMDVAGDAQALAAAAHHSAFNMANALGPWLGGLAISAGYGLTSTGWIGSGLALGGLAIFLVTISLHKRETLQAVPA